MTANRKDELRNEIAQQASEFVVHLYSGSMSENDERRLYEWLDADDAHREEYQRMLDLWTDSSELNLDSAGLVGADETPKRRQWLIAAGLATLAVSAGFFSWLSRDIPPIEAVQYATAVGEQRTISLADGSTLILNTDSEVSIRFSDDVRALSFVRGEAFFSVAEDPDRPFSVNVDDRYVTAIGTKFNIYRKTGETTVAVIEGTVSIHAADQTATSIDANLVDGGQIGTFTGNKLGITVSAVPNIEDFHSWRIGVVRFDDVSLQRLVDEYNRYNTRKIRIADDYLGEYRIGGVYQLAKVEAMLVGLELNYPLKVLHTDDQFVLVGAE